MFEVTVKTYNLNKLQNWLDYQLKGSFLLLLSYFYIVTLYVALVGAVVFIPLLLHVLFEQKRYGWLLSFLGLVAGPALLIYLVGDDWYWASISMFIFMFCFYVYCAALRFVIPNWGEGG